mmetsp:Transcript_937/g.1418  ORF Transcript_937/g.1418 Transcript_937/m.1418 type:complete len:84 (-) Transcript_937:335-586(-)
MGLTAALIGGVTGVSAHMFNNALRKVPVSRSPWLHVTGFVVGCWSGNKYVQLERDLVEDINEIRADRGLPPMVGSNAWIKYQT